MHAVLPWGWMGAGTLACGLGLHMFLENLSFGSLAKITQPVAELSSIPECLGPCSSSLSLGGSLLMDRTALHLSAWQ